MLFRNSTGERVNRWRTDGRPIEAPRNKSGETSPQEENLTFGDPGRPNPETRRRNTGGNSSFRSTTHIDHAEDRGADPREWLRQAAMVSGDAKPSTSPSVFHRDIRLRDNDPIRHNEAIIGAPLRRYGGNQAGKRRGLNGREQSATGTGRPEPDINLETSYTARVTSMTPPPGTSRVRSFTKISEPRNSVSRQGSLPSDGDRAMRGSADIQNVPTMFGTKVSNAIGNTSATFGNHSPAVAIAPGKVTGQNESASVPTVSGNLDFGGSLTHLSEGSTSTDRSSTIAGQLWLDTMSLREWLQAYLTWEMRHASQTANRPGVALA